MKKFGFLLFIIFLVFSSKLQAQINSVLSSGTWYKFAITETGIYELKGSDLENAGITLQGLDPQKIQLYGTSGGMLPQPNLADRPIDLEELAIKIIGGEDGDFSSTDKIVFWGEGSDKVYFDETDKVFSYENNLFSDTSYYFLNVNSEVGKRIEPNPPIAGNYPIVNTYLSYFIHELDNINILKSGRFWFGEKFDINLDQTFATDLTKWVPGSDLKLRSAVMASSFAQSSFSVSVNSLSAGTHQLSAIPDSRYTIKGTEDTKLFTVALPTSNTENIEINYTYSKQNGAGYLNYFLAQIEKNATLESGFLALTIPKQNDLVSTLNVSVSSASTELWDVNSFNEVKKINSAVSSNLLTANINTDTTAHLVVVDINANFLVPNFIAPVANQNLHNYLNTDLLIITSPIFIEQALELKNHKLSQGISTRIALTYQVYNEFSSGRKDITALRDFAKYLFDYAGLKHLLLFGKGTYDYKNLEQKNNSFVPIYESRNSLSPLYTYGSDDYLGFLEDDEGEWAENLQGDHTIDIGVGRLPVKSVDDAIAVVEKIKKYHSNSTIGNWRKKVYFVAENGDFNIHQRDAERLATLIDTIYSAFDPQKIYIDAYPIEALPGGTKAPLVNEAILKTFETGALIINYTGHGNEEQWAKSNVFNKEMIEGLDNDTFYPLIVTATCEFGRHDDANQISAGEELVVKPEAGAIGLITTSRPVFASSNYKLNLAFYSSVLATESGIYKTLGQIFGETKNNSLLGPNNRNFSLLADPSLRLAYPQKFIKLDSLNGNALSSKDSISALEHVVFTGSLRGSSGEVLSDYDGAIQINFYDKPTVKKTRGNFGAPFTYNDRDNKLFSGSSTVKNGQFTFQFVTPLDISYQVMEGKISMYSVATDSIDANGANVNIKIGGTNANPSIDTTPPVIDVFMEDTTFVNEDLVSANSLLIARFYDENGINLSKSQIGHNITYSLDGGDPVSLNDFFQYDLDSYQSGIVLFPLQNIVPGNHLLTLKAWDTFNNPTETDITFNVANEQEVFISEVSVFPNPSPNEAYFTFKHNLSGNDLNVTLKILNRSGQVVHTKEIEYSNASSTINDISWNGRNSSGQKLAEGLYIYSITVRSVSSGASNSFFGRLITIN
ncbi:hypothetical protein MNBD_BACTEROID06-632 [hydrothermal vent metagenome]|uniref:Gingipain domain-containing protein n=1 Tax=hydrothermal vent metagenome TaxID=652676 RepID=A0A3B0UAE5_9ZZZZ